MKLNNGDCYEAHHSFDSINLNNRPVQPGLLIIEDIFDANILALC